VDQISKAVMVLGVALVVIGVFAIYQAYSAYGLYPNCTPFETCPDSLGTSGEFLGGFFSTILGVGVAFYGYARSD
jgi:hypothetical protein